MKRELLLEILELTKLQSKALKDDKIDEFELLLKKRQEIMDQIDRLHQVDPLLREEKNIDILDELCLIDKENRVEFDKQLDEAKQKIREARQMKKRDDIYSNPYGLYREEGVFFDKK